MNINEILNFQTLEQKEFSRRLQNIKKEVKGEDFENGRQYFSFLSFYKLSDTIKKLDNSENLNYFTGLDENTNAEFIFKKIQDHKDHLDNGKKINVMALDYGQFHYVNYEIFKNKNNEIEIRIYDSLLEVRKDEDTGNKLLSGIKKFYKEGIDFHNGKKVEIYIQNSDLQFLLYNVWRDKNSKEIKHELDPSFNCGRKINGDFSLLKERVKIFDCVLGFDKNVKFSIGYSPQQDKNHNNCGQHSFMQNALKDLLKEEKLLEFFPIVKYTEKQNETNVVFAFLIEIFIFFRRLFTDAYKCDTQKMFKLIEIITEISILEQNSKILLQGYEIDCDIVKELRDEILNIIKNEFKKNEDDYSMDRVKNELLNLFEKKIESKLREKGYKLESISEDKIMNLLKTLDSNEYKDNFGNKIDKECLFKGNNINFLVYAINQMNIERGV